MGSSKKKYPPKKVKKPRNENESHDNNYKRIRIEKITNAHRIEDKILAGEEITEFKIITTDWDKVIQEHEQRLKN